MYASAHHLDDVSEGVRHNVKTVRLERVRSRRFTDYFGAKGSKPSLNQTRLFFEELECTGAARHGAAPLEAEYLFSVVKQHQTTRSLSGQHECAVFSFSAEVRAFDAPRQAVDHKLAVAHGNDDGGSGEARSRSNFYERLSGQCRNMGVALKGKDLPGGHRALEVTDEALLMRAFEALDAVLMVHDTDACRDAFFALEARVENDVQEFPQRMHAVIIVGLPARA